MVEDGHREKEGKVMEELKWDWWWRLLAKGKRREGGETVHWDRVVSGSDLCVTVRGSGWERNKNRNRMGQVLGGRDQNKLEETEKTCSAQRGWRSLAGFPQSQDLCTQAAGHGLC